MFVQGCNLRCKNCFNPETWDFNGGKQWNEKIKNEFMELIDRPYIKRISFLGGECLAQQNLNGILSLIKEIRAKYPFSKNSPVQNPRKIGILEDENSNEIIVSSEHKNIWLYTGFEWESIISPTNNWEETKKRREILNYIDVLVDGRFIDEQKDLTLKWRGSKNQRVINVQESLQQNKIVLYCD